MSEYVLILFWIAFAAFMYKRGNFKTMKKIDNNECEYCNFWFAILVFVPIILMAAGRGDFADTGSYLRNYHRIPSSISSFSSFMSERNKDSGFYALSAILKMFFSLDDYWYLFVIALFQGVSLVAFYRRYSEEYIISVFLFIASTDYISWMFNGMRQFIAVTIILFSTPFLLKRKYISAIIIILLAASMHRSAIIFIPILFIVNGEIWNKKTILLLLMCSTTIFFVDSFTSFLNDSLADTQYANVVSDYQNWNDDGTNPIRVVVYSVPTIVSLVYRDKIKEERNEVINLATNMSIISTSIYILSMFTSGVFIGRIPIYFSLFNYILLPWEINHCFSKKDRTLILSLMVISYLAYYYYAMHIHSHIF